jgi:uncharacterized protein YjbI with pentapeptide repeats
MLAHCQLSKVLNSFFAYLTVIYSGADLSDADLRNADFSLANVTKVVSVNMIQSSFLRRLVELVSFSYSCATIQLRDQLGI